MKKLIYSTLIAAGLAAGGSAFAQGSGQDTQPGGNAGPSFGPPVGSAEYYGNSGWTPPAPDHGYRDRIYGPRGAVPAYPYTRPEVRRERELAEIQRQRERERQIAENNRRQALENQRLERERARMGNARERDGFEQRRDRDRDGDGINNRRDRFPDDPRRS